MNLYEPPGADDSPPLSQEVRHYDIIDVAIGCGIAFTLVLAALAHFVHDGAFGKDSAGMALALLGGGCVLTVAALIGYRELRQLIPRPAVSLILGIVAAVTLPLWAVILRI